MVCYLFVFVLHGTIGTQIPCCKKTLHQKFKYQEREALSSLSCAIICDLQHWVNVSESGLVSLGLLVWVSESGLVSLGL